MRRTSKVAVVIGLALGSVGVGCTLVAGVGDYAVGDAGGSRRGDAAVDAKRGDDATSRTDGRRGNDATGGEDSPASHDAGVDVLVEPDATGPAACGILDASAPIVLCPDGGTRTPSALISYGSPSPVIAIVADGSGVFWSDGGAIWRYLLSDAADQFKQLYPPDSDGGPPGVVSDIATDKTLLYFAGIPGQFASSNVGSCSKTDGCNLTGGIYYGTAQNRATGVASDNVNVFWTDDAGLHTCATVGCDGGINDIATGNAAPGPLALGSSFADWVDVDLGRIVHTAKGDLSGPNPTPPNPLVSGSFVPTAPGTSQLVTTTIGLYWASPFALNVCPTSALQSAATCMNGAVRVGPVFATPPTTCSSKGTKNIPIATDDSNVYYVAPAGSSCSGGAALVKCTAQGSCAVLASGLPDSILAIAADDRNVYWAEIDENTPTIKFVPHS